MRYLNRKLAEAEHSLHSSRAKTYQLISESLVSGESYVNSENFVFHSKNVIKQFKKIRRLKIMKQLVEKIEKWFADFVDWCKQLFGVKDTQINVGPVVEQPVTVPETPTNEVEKVGSKKRVSKKTVKKALPKKSSKPKNMDKKTEKKATKKKGEKAVKKTAKKASKKTGKKVKNNG